MKIRLIEEIAEDCTVKLYKAEINGVCLFDVFYNHILNEGTFENELDAIQARL